MTKIQNDYYDADTLSGHQNRLSKSILQIIHLNIHSLPDKFDKLKLLLASTHFHPDIILLCETFLNERNNDLYQISGYQFISKCRTQKGCGGVAMYVKNDLNYKIRNDLSIFIIRSCEIKDAVF